MFAERRLWIWSRGSPLKRHRGLRQTPPTNQCAAREFRDVFPETVRLGSSSLQGLGAGRGGCQRRSPRVHVARPKAPDEAPEQERRHQATIRTGHARTHFREVPVAFQAGQQCETGKRCGSNSKTRDPAREFRATKGVDQ